MSSEIDLLRKKKALELRRKMLLSQNKTAQEPPVPEEPRPDPREIVRGVLAGRGEEVMETARRYYPAEVAQIEVKLAELIKTGTLKGPITGEELYSLLRRLGLDFSLDIKIRVSEGGKLKSLEEKLRERNP
jgi:DNA-binding TFAR19-related protein (PDSD5 family)